MPKSSPSSTPPEPQETAAQFLARKYPPLAKYWPNLFPNAETGTTGVSAPQAAFLVLDCREAFYGGAAGGGKSDAILAAALQYVGHPKYNALILRRTFPELIGAEGLLTRAQLWLANTDAKRGEEGKLWTFPSGATLRFGHVENEHDKFKYDGQAYQYIGFDEATSFSETQFEWVGFTRSRRVKEIQAAGIPVRTRASGTPTGVGYGWVRRRFITHPEPDVVVIPATVYDNPGLDAEEYAAGLSRMPEETRKRLLLGDWDVFEGAAFPDFSEKLHVVDPFEVPGEWLRFESFDHGVTNPSCALAWAADYDGNLIVFDSYYSPGLVSAHATALGKLRETWWPKDEGGWLTQTPVSYADPAMWNTTGHETKFGEPASVVTEYHERGIEGFMRANNDRVAGRLRLLELMRPDPIRMFPSFHKRAGTPGSPGLFIVGAKCSELVEQLRTAPANQEPVGQKIGIGEIVDPKWESGSGHACATARYGAMSWQTATDAPKPEREDPRARALQRMVDQQAEADAEVDEYTYV